MRRLSDEYAAVAGGAPTGSDSELSSARTRLFVRKIVEVVKLIVRRKKAVEDKTRQQERVQRASTMRRMHQATLYHIRLPMATSFFGLFLLVLYAWVGISFSAFTNRMDDRFRQLTILVSALSFSSLGLSCLVHYAMAANENPYAKKTERLLRLLMSLMICCALINIACTYLSVAFHEDTCLDIPHHTTVSLNVQLRNPPSQNSYSSNNNSYSNNNNNSSSSNNNSNSYSNNNSNSNNNNNNSRYSSNNSYSNNNSSNNNNNNSRYSSNNSYSSSNNNNSNSSSNNNNSNSSSNNNNSNSSSSYSSSSNNSSRNSSNNIRDQLRTPDVLVGVSLNSDAVTQQHESESTPEAAYRPAELQRDPLPEPDYVFEKKHLTDEEYTLLYDTLYKLTIWKHQKHEEHDNREVSSTCLMSFAPPRWLVRIMNSYVTCVALNMYFIMITVQIWNNLFCPNALKCEELMAKLAKYESRETAKNKSKKNADTGPNDGDKGADIIRGPDGLVTAVTLDMRDDECAKA